MANAHFLEGLQQRIKTFLFNQQAHGNDEPVVAARSDDPIVCLDGCRKNRRIWYDFSFFSHPPKL